MRTQEAASNRVWRSMRLALPLVVVSLTAWAGDPPEGASLFMAQPATVQATSGPSLAFGRYIASLGQTARPAGWETVTVEIDASLPGLAKQGRLQAIRRRGASGHPEYQVLHVEGDSIVKQQVIARYLTAEKEAEAMPKASVAVSPANYKFRYVGSIASAGIFVYVYQVTPRKKRAGLMEGQLWIDAATGLAVHQGGRLVKKPSIFVRRVELVRDTRLHDGVPDLETTHLAIDTRLVGRAELTIREQPYSDSERVIAALHLNAGVRP
jgi:hypothetical protein